MPRGAYPPTMALAAEIVIIATVPCWAAVRSGARSSSGCRRRLARRGEYVDSDR